MLFVQNIVTMEVDGASRSGHSWKTMGWCQLETVL